MANNLEFPFPHQGKDEGWPKSKQPILTSPSLQNVRPFDVYANRARGGQRPGLRKLYSAQIGGDARPIVAIAQITIVTS